MIKERKASDICMRAELTKFGNIDTLQKIICLHFHHFVCTTGILTPADFGWACVEQMHAPAHWVWLSGSALPFTSGTPTPTPQERAEYCIYPVYFFQFMLCMSFLFINMIIRKFIFSTPPFKNLGFSIIYYPHPAQLFPHIVHWWGIVRVRNRWNISLVKISVLVL